MSFGYNPVFGKMLSFESSYREKKTAGLHFTEIRHPAAAQTL